jgi:hypothetical protein
MNTNLLKTLKQIIAQYGVDVLGDSRRVNAILNDLAPKESKAEKKALIACLMNGFHNELKNALGVALEDRQLCKNRLAQRLHDDEGLDLTLCNNTLDLLEAVLFGEQPQKTTCRNCGKELQSGWKTCPYCSTAVKDTGACVNENTASAVISSSGGAGYGIRLIDHNDFPKTIAINPNLNEGYSEPTTNPESAKAHAIRGIEWLEGHNHRLYSYDSSQAIEEYKIAAKIDPRYIKGLKILKKYRRSYNLILIISAMLWVVVIGIPITLVWGLSSHKKSRKKIMKELQSLL